MITWVRPAAKEEVFVTYGWQCQGFRMILQERLTIHHRIKATMTHNQANYTSQDFSNDQIK